MTGFPELDALLRRFTADVRTELRDDLVGLYLQGSFALGEGDEWSDVDFVCVTREPVEPARVQPLHERLYDLPTPWAQHLEGSYLPAALIRRVDPDETPVPFLDNGARELVLDPHCNTALVRVVLREHGRALAGPPAAELVDAVDPADLRAEAERKLADYAAWAPEGPMTQWKQPYLVLTFCRILRTIACGDVTSKRVAADWALETLEERWHPLIRRAVADRRDRWTRAHAPADPALAAETVAFADACSRRSSGGLRSTHRADAARLRRMADQSYAAEGTLARSLLSRAIDEAEVEGGTIVEVLNGIPGARDSIARGREQLGRGEGTPLDEL